MLVEYKGKSHECDKEEVFMVESNTTQCCNTYDCIVQHNGDVNCTNSECCLSYGRVRYISLRCIDLED